MGTASGLVTKPHIRAPHGTSLPEHHRHNAPKGIPVRRNTVFDFSERNERTDIPQTLINAGLEFATIFVRKPPRKKFKHQARQALQSLAGLSF